MAPRLLLAPYYSKRLSAPSDIKASLAFRIFRVYRVPQEKNFSLSYFVFKITLANHLARSLNHLRETDRSSTHCRRIEEMDNQLTLIIVVAMLVIIFAAVGAWVYTRSSRSRRLKAKFGPEYDQTVERLHNRELAETELQDRERRVKRFHIVRLSMQDASQYRERWAAVQAHFVDAPKEAVEEAHQLVHEVMKKRGYPVTGFEQDAADLSVEYPTIVTYYRAANRIAESNRKGVAETEELRQAVVDYRSLFEELLGTAEIEVKDKPSKNRSRLEKIIRGGRVHENTYR
jgi:hypothetical protein